MDLDFGVTGTMRTPGTYYAAIALFCAICLVISFAGATDQSGKEKIPYPKNWTGKDGDSAGHPISADMMIANLEKRGIDVTEVRAALENGDIDAVKEWLAKQGRPGRDQVKGTPNFSAHIARLEPSGIDVSEVRAALEIGDTDAVKEWLAKQGRPNRVAMNGTPDFAALITRLEQRGIDVTDVKAALENGDTGAVKEWLDAQRSERQPGAGFPPREGKPEHRIGETDE